MELNCKTTGIVTDVKTLWWIKVKLKAVRLHPLDGVAFPHSITVKYRVNNTGYTKKIYVPWRVIPPPKGAEVTIYYNESKPSKCKAEIPEV